MMRREWFRRIVACWLSGTLIAAPLLPVFARPATSPHAAHAGMAAPPDAAHHHDSGPAADHSAGTPAPQHPCTGNGACSLDCCKSCTHCALAVMASTPAVSCGVPPLSFATDPSFADFIPAIPQRPPA